MAAVTYECIEFGVQDGGVTLAFNLPRAGHDPVRRYGRLFRERSLSARMAGHRTSQ